MRFTINSLFLAIVLLANTALASIEIGIGNSSVNSGRLVPALAVAYTGSDYAISGFSTGVRNAYYYQSTYQVGYFKTWKSGTFWNGDISSGFGGALAYSVRGFQDEGATTEEKAEDILLGPAVRVNWSYGNVFYVNLETNFGLRNLFKTAGSLSFQDVVCLSVGARLW